jgi:hypothetical protein
MICDCCRRKVDHVREGSFSQLYFGDDKICNECFREWYDGDRPTMGTDDSDKLNIGNWIRKKHGFEPIEEMMDEGLGI